MSSGVEVPGSQRRPGIWSYFSLSGTRRRPLSVSLPRTFDPNRDADPHEKLDRHSRHRSSNSNGLMGDYKGGSIMNQGQRLRYLKTGGLIAFVLLALYFIAPRSGLSRSMFNTMPTRGHMLIAKQAPSQQAATRPRAPQKQHAQNPSQRTSPLFNTPS